MMERTSSVNWGLLALVAVALLLVVAVVTGRRLPLITGDKAAFYTLLIVGVAMCAMGPLAEIAEKGAWLSLSGLIGIILGGLALVLAAAVLFGIQLPLIASERTAFLALAGIVVAKVLAAGVHRLVIG